jgi:hypothetical protein
MLRNELIGAVLAVLSLVSGVLAQEQPMKVKGGHLLGETSEQFFAEGHEGEAGRECAAGDFKSLKLEKKIAKKYCGELTDARKHATSGARTEFDGADAKELFTSKFIFDGGHLVRVDLNFTAPSAESNYSGHSFEEIFAAAKVTYGAPTSESTEPGQNAYGVKYLAHRELWVRESDVLLITDLPGQHGWTKAVSFTRAEYDRTMEAGKPKPVNPLQ